ncbi:Protein of unknown function [Cotesia congregata]|uniref:Secreted protein n=1 Tax=Cotesia congregata TaxID=51543 RepID=A0A8J2EIE7_COTCN|nr:Protein of unknown function [Cotesia congregata]
MCKLSLMSVILTSSLSLSFSTNNCSCEEKKDLYELKLSVNDLDMFKFAEDGWNKLVAEGRSRGATIRGSFSVQYTQESKLFTLKEDILYLLYMWPGNDDPAEREQRNIFNLFYRNNLFCRKE